MKLARDLCLIGLAVLFALAYPFLSEVLTPSSWSELAEIIGNNPLIVVVLAMPFVGLIALMVFIHKIDKWESKDTETRHLELLKTIQKNNKTVQRLINEIRQERNERSKKEKQ